MKEHVLPVTVVETAVIVVVVVEVVVPSNDVDISQDPL